MTTATEVRIVEAGREHIPFVAWVVMTANRSHLPKGMWDFVIGEDGDDAVLRYLEVLAQTETLHWGHYSLFLVAEVDGAPAAGMCGFFENELGAASVMAAAAEANEKTGRPAEEVAAGWERAKSIMGIVMEHEPGAWVVEHVGTKPEFRRRGLVERLVHATLERGRERGATTADIGVLMGNDPAQRAYEKCGFRVVEEKLAPEFEAVYGSAGARMMRRAVS